MRAFYASVAALLLTVGTLSAQFNFPVNIDITDYEPTEIVMPASPLTTQVLFVGGVDLVQTTETYGVPAGQAIAKEWHDFIGFTPDDSDESLGWISVNHENIYRDDRIGDGGGMTTFRVQRDETTGDLVVMDQTLDDGRSGQFFNVDFVNTVGETGMNCGGISSIVDGRIWTAEEWFRGDNGDINTGSPRNVSSLPVLVGNRTNQGVRDTAEWTISAPDFPAFDGLVVPKYENFNWMVEIDPKQAVAIRKQYNWGRQGFEGGVVTADNKYVYLGVDATPGFWLRFVADTPGDFTKGATEVYKHDNPVGQRWIEIDNEDSDKMLNLTAEAIAVGGTMYNRNEWVAIDAATGIIYWTETGRDNPGSRWDDAAGAGAVFAPHHIQRAADQGVADPADPAYWDYYGRVLAYDPATEEVTVTVEGGPFFATSPDVADYPSKHLSNPDGLNVMTIDGQSFLVINEDLNGSDFGRMPAGISNRLCELYLLDLSIENATVEDLIRISATPAGSEVTGAMPTPDGKSLLVNSQHPSTNNPFPYNHSLTFAIHGFDELTVTSLEDPEVDPTAGFSIYPNPTQQIVFLNTTQDVALYNQLGQRLRVYRNVNQIDVSQLPTGTYFLQNEEGETVQLNKE